MTPVDYWLSGCQTLNRHEAVNTSRPVLFEYQNEEHFNYYGGGSAFIFSWDSHGYAVTAKHVAKQGAPEHIRIAVDDESFTFFRFDAILSPQGEEEDWKDLTFYRIDRRVSRDQWAHLVMPLDMNALCAARQSYRIGCPMWVSGYPETHSSIDYDADHISLTRCIIAATYAGGDPSSRGKHRIRTDADLSSLNGMSGSPVFVEPRADLTQFAGILIQGSASSQLGHFIGVVPFAAMLAQIHKAAA